VSAVLVNTVSLDSKTPLLFVSINTLTNLVLLVASVLPNFINTGIFPPGSPVINRLELSMY
jgi:hypothetical protein